MADSILDSVKNLLGLNAGYTPFDIDVITHINATFSVLDQLGVGPEGGFSIEDNVSTWGDYSVPANQLHLVKTYVALKVRMLFDPPTTSFHISAMNDQLKEYEWRLNNFREDALIAAQPPEVPPEEEF